MAAERVQRLIVRGKDWYANIPVTRIEKVEDVVFAYLGDAFVGMFDLGAVNMLYITGERGNEG